MQVRLDTLEKQLNNKMSNYGKAMTFLQRNMSIQEKIMFIFASENLTQMFRRIRYIREYSSFQRAQGMLIRDEQADVRNTKNSLLDAKNNLLASKSMMQKTQNDLQFTKNSCEQKVQYLNQNLNMVKEEIANYQRREAAIDAQIDRIIQAEIEAERRRQAEEARRRAEAEARVAAARAEAARKAAQAKAEKQAAAAKAAKAAAAAKAAEAKRKADAEAKKKAEAAAQAAAAKRKAQQDALNAKRAAEARKKAEDERKRAEAAARKAKSDAEKAEAARKAEEARRRAAEAKRQEEEAKRKEAEAKRQAEEAKAAEEAARKRAEAEAREAKERAKEAERTTERAAKVERQEAKATKAAPETDQLSSSFEANKGRLPLPVAGGQIVRHYGRYTVSGASNVTLDNKGIDIKGSAGGAVRAVFNGRVSSIFQYGGRYIVMIRHGKFISVYSGLAGVSVSNGTNVSTGQTIGSIGLDEAGEPVIQFQLRKESSKLNPEAWVR